MTDNVQLPGAGATIATDDISGKHFQRIKLTLGGDGEDGGTISRDRALPIVFGDTPAVDGFGRLRISTVRQLLDEKAVTASPVLGNFASGGGSFSKPANKASFYLTTGGIGSVARRQTRQRAIYQPGKSQHITATFTLGTLTPGIIQRVGYFDGSNGIFFEVNGSDYYFVVRSNTSGSIVDTAIARADWYDKLDGTGPSGVTFDPTKSQILDMDFQWLGVGRVRFGFVIGGVVVPCVAALHANILSGVYMANPNQPVRWEIIGAASSAVTSLEAICAAVVAEGGYDDRGITIAHDSDGTVKAVNGALTYGELLAVRLTTAGALVGTSVPKALSLICTTAGMFMWEVWLNASGMTAGTWTAPIGSITEQNTTRTGTYTPGTGVKIASGYSIDAGTAQGIEAALAAGLGYDINAAAADVLSVRIMNFAGNNNYAVALVMRQEA